jgi:hypothetical protein
MVSTMSRLPRLSLRTIPPTVAALTVLTLVPLLIWDASPQVFPDRAHDALAALPLALIGVACLLHSLVRRSPLPDLLKSCALAAAFFFWAANQLWPEHPRATVFNDIAVALFVVDVFLAIVGWPTTGPKVPAAEGLSRSLDPAD